MNEDIQRGPAPKEITYKGYKTKNLHHSEDATRAFQKSIERVDKGLATDNGNLLKALKATDEYMAINDKHLMQQRAANPEEITQWSKKHNEAGTALKAMGELLHHYDYWNNHRQELQTLQANAGINNAVEEMYMSTSHNPFQDFLDEKKLTPAEMKKREEVAKAMEKDNPGMDMSKKMAIATAVAKRVAEEIELDEAAIANPRAVNHSAVRAMQRSRVARGLPPTPLSSAAKPLHKDELAGIMSMQQDMLNKAYGKKKPKNEEVEQDTVTDLVEAIKNWKNAHNDLMKNRAAASASSKEVRLVRLKKDGSESGLHDATKTFKTEDEARAHHANITKLNPGKGIAHNLYVGSEHKETLK